jgi:hypothetical protein
MVNTLTKTIPAWNPTRQLSKHMLTQPCKCVYASRRRRQPAFGSRHAFFSGDHVARAWQSWVPQATYAWNVPKNHAGVPLTTFSDFNFTTPPSQPNVWQLTGGVEKYDAFSAPVETKNAKGFSKPRCTATTFICHSLHCECEL